MQDSIKSITFFSNYFNHHQKALCDSFYELLGDGFTFVETMPMENFRASMGWGEDTPSYVLRSYESSDNEEKAVSLGFDSDLVIMGTAPEYYIEPRLLANKIIFRYSERPLKEGFIKFFIPRLTKKYIHLHVRNRHRNIHILGASAFTSLDYKKMFDSYPGKCYKFGYFPKHKEYDIKELMQHKEDIAQKSGATTILWMGRMLKLKRADLVISAAALLRKKGYDFRLTLVGDGEERDKLQKLANSLGIDDIVSFEGFLKPDEARDKMADAQIYVMTSNFWEGWGSVIYEACNAGCALVASHACGATPWLCQHDKTGYVFKSGDAVSLANQLEKLINDRANRERLGSAAYEHMHSLWNEKVAASRVIELANAINKGEECPFEDGPCSKAEYVKNNWYK